MWQRLSVWVVLTALCLVPGAASSLDISTAPISSGGTIIGDTIITGDLTANAGQAGSVSNCEMGYTSGTLSMTGDGSAALSASNPCLMAIRSTTNGVVSVVSFTANVTATDGATSQTDGNTFGITATADWASPMPKFIGVITDGTDAYLTLSRVPLQVSGSAATDICQLTDEDCDAQSDVMILTTGLTLSAWVDLPITQVAWVTGTWSTTDDKWTFAETAYTGFNQLYESIWWTFPAGQNGAKASTYHTDANAPVWSNATAKYRIEHTGETEYLVSLTDTVSDDSGTDGTDVVCPFVASSSYATTHFGNIRIVHAGTQRIPAEFGIAAGSAVTGDIYQYNDFAGSLSLLQNANWATGDVIHVELRYQTL